MAGPLIVGFSSMGSAAGAAAMDPPVPAPVPLYSTSIVNGQRMVLLGGLDGNAGTVTGPTGFAAISGITNGPEAGNAVTLACFTKVASGETDAGYAVSWVNTERLTAAMLLIDGQNGVNIAAASDGNSAAPLAPSVTTTVDGCLIIRGFVCDNGGSLAQNDGTLTLTRIFHLLASPAAGMASLFGGVHTQVSAGATGTFTFSMVSEQWRAFTIAIEPGAFVGVDPDSGGIFGSANMNGGLQ